MPRTALVVVLLCVTLAGLTGLAGVSLAAPPGPGDLTRFIETARKSIAENEQILSTYAVEMRGLVANDPASAKRREEIRILKQYYVRENEALRAKINDDYKKIQEFRARGIQ